MISTVERELIVRELNKEINIPYLPESLEGVLIDKVVRMSFQALMNVIPPEMQELLHTEEGLTIGEHLDELKDRFGEYLNMEIDIPFLTEEIEQTLFDMICSLLVGAMVENTNLKLFLEYGGPVPVNGRTDREPPEGPGEVVEQMTAEPPELNSDDHPIDEPLIGDEETPEEEAENTISEETVEDYGTNEKSEEAPGALTSRGDEDPDTLKDSIE